MQATTGNVSSELASLAFLAVFSSFLGGLCQRTTTAKRKYEMYLKKEQESVGLSALGVGTTLPVLHKYRYCRIRMNREA